MHCALFCVQVFVRSSHLTHRTFFSDSVVAELTESAGISDSIMTSAVYDPWSHMGTPLSSKVVAEVSACVDRAVDYRRPIKNTREQWYAVGGVRPSSKVSVSQSRVRISTRVGAGRVEYEATTANCLGASDPTVYVPLQGNQGRRKWAEAQWSYLGVSKLEAVLRNPARRP